MVEVIRLRPMVIYGEKVRSWKLLAKVAYKLKTTRKMLAAQRGIISFLFIMHALGLLSWCVCNLIAFVLYTVLYYIRVDD